MPIKRFMTDVEAIVRTLLLVRAPPAAVPPEPGVYAVFVVNPQHLPGIQVDSSGLLFIGMTKSDLRRRIRFTHRQSGYSTLRRSLGAILKDQLGLRPSPPEPIALTANRHHYQFADESPLDDWMYSHLIYGFCTIEHHVRSIEMSLIKRLRPPLNFFGWENPQTAKIKALRDICRKEAQQA